MKESDIPIEVDATLPADLAVMVSRNSQGEIIDRVIIVNIGDLLVRAGEAIR